MASTEGAPAGSEIRSQNARLAQAARAGEVAGRTGSTVGRLNSGQSVRDRFSTPAGAGVLSSAAGQIGEATLAPTAGYAAPAGLGTAAEALARRAGTGAVGAVGTVVGAAALIVVPTNTAPGHVVDLGPSLRAVFPYDSPYGQIEMRVDGRWRETGVEVSPGSEGMAADLDALEAQVGPLDDILRPGALISERRNGLGLAALNAYSSRAREAVGIQELKGLWEAHHLIPFDVVNTLSPGLQHKIAASGWQMDRRENLIALPKDKATSQANGKRLPEHNGAHRIYNSDVKAMLSGLELDYQAMNEQELRNELARVENVMRGLILRGEYHAVVR